MFIYFFYDLSFLIFHLFVWVKKFCLSGRQKNTSSLWSCGLRIFCLGKWQPCWVQVWHVPSLFFKRRLSLNCLVWDWIHWESSVLCSVVPLLWLPNHKIVAYNIENYLIQLCALFGSKVHNTLTKCFIFFLLNQSRQQITSWIWNIRLLLSMGLRETECSCCPGL